MSNNPPRWNPSQNSSYSYPANSNYGCPPPPPPQTYGNVPPPLYGYNSGTQYYSSQQLSSWQQQQMAQYSTQSAAFQCEACQVSLESQAALRAHIESHITCTKCSFSASRKVVKGHFQSVHGKFSGGGFKTVTIAIPGCPVQRFRICVGNHPEDVQKWIQDRKKRFPRKNRAGADATVYKKGLGTEVKESKAAAALGSLLDGYGSSSSSESDDERKPTTSLNESQASKTENMDRATDLNDLKREAVGELAASVAVEKNQEGPRQLNYRTRPCRFFVRNGSCRNGDACTFSHEIGASHPSRAANHPRIKRQKRSSSSATLLRKLLEGDVRREATLTVQLLQHIVDTNYLEKDGNGEERSG